jgi:predicted branched-subunit amino acid permease
MTTATMRPEAARTSGPRREFLAGVAAMGALLAGLAPFGLVVGMAAAASDSVPAAWAGTWLVYSGSAHLAVLSALADGEGILAVVVAGLLVNARLLAFSASLAPTLRGESRRFRLAAAALLVDPLWALVTARAGQASCKSYFLGAGLTLWFGWAAAVTVGAVFAQAGTSAGWAAVGVPLCLLALVVPGLRRPGGMACVGAAAVVGSTSAAWPAGTEVLAAMIAGTAAAAVARRRAR